jgi:DNA modification methylase
MLVVPDGLPPREQHDNRMVPAAMPALSRRALPLGEGRRVTAGEWATSGVAAEGDVVSGWHLLTGDCREVLPTLGVEADAVVCDPPYDLTNRVIDAWACRLCGRIRGGLDTDPGVCLGCGGPMHRRRSAGGGFMGKAWDATGVAFDPATWRIVKDAMKPGAYLLAFGSTRTYHRLVCAVEDAGFSIIDTIVWHHGQGFPKHKSLLKPASELIVLARKPGTGPGLNVDACRVEVNGGRPLIAGDPKDGRFAGVFRQGSSHAGTTTAGRYPPNLLLSHSPGCRRVGTKRVRGSHPVKPGGGTCETTYVHARTVDIAPAARAPHDFTGPDGREEVESWECVRGFRGIVPSYEGDFGAVSPLDTPLSLLDQLASLLRVARAHSMSHSTPSLDASWSDHSDRTRSAVSSDGLVDDAACALGVRELLDSLGGYPSCRRFCGERLRSIAEAARAGLPSLLDALGCVHRDLCELVRSQSGQSNAPPSNSDDALLEGHVPHSDENKSAATSQPEKPSGSVRTGHLLAYPSLPSSTDGSSRDESGLLETSLDSAGTSAAIRLLTLVCADLSWRFLPGALIQRCENYIILDPCPIALLDEQAGERVSRSGGRRGTAVLGIVNDDGWQPRDMPRNGHDDAGGPSRFFPTFAPDAEDAPVMRAYYCAKASRWERNAGLEGMPERRSIDDDWVSENRKDAPSGGRTSPQSNHHPTVKPIALMRWLVRLVCPSGGTVLDPFAGSGSTGCACAIEGVNFIGIEQDASYVAIAERRIAWWAANPDGRATGVTKGPDRSRVYGLAEGRIERVKRTTPPADGYRPLSLFAAGDD